MSAERERQRRVQEAGRDVVRQVHVALRTIAMHDVTNRASRAALSRARESVNTLWTLLGGLVRLQFVEDIVFVNDQRLRVSAVVADQLEALRQRLAARKIGGFEFSRPAQVENLALALELLARHVETDAEIAALHAGFQELGDIGISLLEPKELIDNAEYEVLRINRLDFALQTYGRAVVAFREAVLAFTAGRDPLSGRVHIPRVVQDLIDIAIDRASFLLRLSPMQTANRELFERGDYASRHAATTTVYSIMVGKLLGLDRLALLDLGVSALLADIGFAVLPPEQIDRPRLFDESEKNEVRAAMIRATQALIGRGRANDAVLRRIIVAHEHHTPFLDVLSGQPAPLHPFSRIVAVADAYAALTSTRAWRPAMSSGEALSVLRLEAGSRFDPVVVEALAALLGTAATHARAMQVAAAPVLPAEIGAGA